MSIFVVLILAALAWAAFHGWQLPNSLRYRPSQGRAWRSTFPAASRKDIRDFLSVFVSAFSCRDSEKQHFRPDDEVLGIYRAVNPSRRLPDAGELETLAKALRDKYGLMLDEIWHEGLTLGGLFQRVQQSRGKRTAAEFLASRRVVGSADRASNQREMNDTPAVTARRCQV